MKEEDSLLPEPWLAADEDPLTGLPNLLALISDLPGKTGDSGGVAVGFDIRGLGAMNQERGRDAGDRALVSFARCLVRAASSLGPERLSLYRLGGDEFCAIIRGDAGDAARLLQALSASGGAPPFKHSVVELSPESGSSSEAFIDIWLPLEHGLQTRAGSQEDPLRHVARRLVEQVKETLEQLKASRRMAHTDDVSGLPNQRAARYIMREHLARYKETGRKLSLLFVDGDNLRKYNDNLGYGPGNEMIRRLGSVLSGATLPGELVARWLSGDEFMVILPGYGKKEAIDKAESLCKSVREESESWIYPTTVSVGVATFPDDDDDLESLLSKVEEANSKAKALGRDRVCRV